VVVGTKVMEGVSTARMVVVEVEGGTGTSVVEDGVIATVTGVVGAGVTVVTVDWGDIGAAVIVAGVIDGPDSAVSGSERTSMRDPPGNT